MPDTVRLRLAILRSFCSWSALHSLGLGLNDPAPDQLLAQGDHLLLGDAMLGHVLAKGKHLQAKPQQQLQPMMLPSNTYKLLLSCQHCGHVLSWIMR